jgi:hypothetical protein
VIDLDFPSEKWNGWQQSLPAVFVLDVVEPAHRSWLQIVNRADLLAP